MASIEHARNLVINPRSTVFYELPRRTAIKQISIPYLRRINQGPIHVSLQYMRTHGDV